MGNLNLNQFEMAPQIGDTAQVASSGVIDCVVNTGQTLVAGQKVSLVASTDKKVIVVTAAATGTVGVGIVMKDIQHSTFTAAMHVQIALFGGPGVVMQFMAGAAIAAGAYVEMQATAGYVITKSSQKTIGIALDDVSSGQLVRILITRADYSS